MNKVYTCVLLREFVTQNTDKGYIDYFMVGECVRFLFTSCEGSRKRTSVNDPSQRVSNKNRTNKLIMK